MAPPDDFYPQVAELCKEHGILFIADEIQTGFGRTGKMFAMEHWGVEADLTTIAKSLAGGMPLSAVVGKAEIMDFVAPVGPVGPTTVLFAPVGPVAPRIPTPPLQSAVVKNPSPFISSLKSFTPLLFESQQ